MSEQRTSDDPFLEAIGLLREWHTASSEFNLEDWSRRVRDFLEDDVNE